MKRGAKAIAWNKWYSEKYGGKELYQNHEAWNHKYTKYFLLFGNLMLCDICSKATRHFAFVMILKLYACMRCVAEREIQDTNQTWKIMP